MTPDTPAPDRWLMIMDAAREVGVSRRTIYNWLAQGKLETQRTAGGSIRILARSLYKPSGIPHTDGR